MLTVSDNEKMKINIKRKNVVALGSSSFKTMNFMKDTALMCI